ncbi:uncharacterized protein LOC109845540 isoform X4 [Asparagus officinalis]|uniref:uncharacterized protein LOC109845540 isoform X4 n=1 Tax=Asparagus officinalis TaxID=4686 RepID=UPI00098E1AFA|nr:uncharacterized protein LOC109845540 isoform X4 [Asparagus officinalis]
MASNEAVKVASGSGVTEDSETTVEIKIKTLDSQTYTLRVDKCVPVPALKEQIASVTGVLSHQQRLICRGKVLKDDQLLSAYHVEDGHTLHLVVRQPHQSATPSSSRMESEGGHSGTTSASGSEYNHGSHVAHSFVFESVNVDHGDVDASVISRVISSMFGSIGSTNNVTRNTGGSDIREMILERLGRANSDSGLSDSTQSHSDPTNSQRDRRQTDARFSSTAPLGTQNPPVIPDSLITLSQYIDLMRDDFRREGFGANEVNGVHLNEGRSDDSHSPAAQVGLPTPASLAEMLCSARQLLMNQTGDCIMLARQLEDHTRVTDPVTRMNMQSSAMRSGLLMQKLGSMLLELGRTTMTLRMGQNPAEAVVNAGPANFISATGPNPLMVQAVPFHPGSSAGGANMGPVNPNHGLEGEPPEAPFVPRNIEIRIRTVGRAVPVASTNPSELSAGQQQQEQSDPARNSSASNVVNQAFSAGDSGVRVVPLRTVVAVPAGVNPSPSDSSAVGSVRLFYPLLARVRQSTAGNAGEVDGHTLHQPSVQRENLESNGGGAVGDEPFVSGLSSGAYQVFGSSQQGPPNNNSDSGTQANDNTPGGIEAHDNEQGVFLSNVLHRLMPLISRDRENDVSSDIPSPSTTEIERENLNGSSSRHQGDHPEVPSPKRTKRDGD